MDAESLASLSDRSVQNEYQAPLPAGYQTGQCKFVFVTGSVMSGLGKGTFSSALGRLLQERGYSVTSLKFDGYLNVDAGTLNPYRHGEVFVLDDGTECDMDLGNYERFLHDDLTEANYLTGGKIFWRILNRERQGRYLGRDLQFIPHVTGEIKNTLRRLAVLKKAQVVLVEVGGTIGDLENAYFVEACRQLAYEEGLGSSCFVNVTYVSQPPALGEQKTKPAQVGMRQLLSMGVQPHLMVVRCPEPLQEKAREKIALYSSVPLERVIALSDCDTTYAVPEVLRKTRADQSVLDILGLPASPVQPEKAQAWADYLSNLRNPARDVTVAVMGKYVSVRDAYHSVLNALEHAGAQHGARVHVKWVDTQKLENGEAAVQTELADVDAIVVPGGFGSRGAEGKISSIRYARENHLPFLGLCYGFQLAVVEHARNVLGLAKANTTENDPSTPDPVITLLPEQYKIEGLGGSMRLGGRDILLAPGSQVRALYGGAPVARERFRHRYEVNPDYIDRLQEQGLVFSGKADGAPVMQYLERTGHPYFVASQAHLEYTSRPLRPNPAFSGLIRAALARKNPGKKSA